MRTALLCCLTQRTSTAAAAFSSIGKPLFAGSSSYTANDSMSHLQRVFDTLSHRQGFAYKFDEATLHRFRALTILNLEQRIQNLGQRSVCNPLTIGWAAALQHFRNW